MKHYLPWPSVQPGGEGWEEMSVFGGKNKINKINNKSSFGANFFLHKNIHSFF